MDEQLRAVLESQQKQISDLKLKNYEIESLKDKCKKLETCVDWLFFFVVILLSVLAFAGYYVFTNYDKIKYIMNMVDAVQDMSNYFGL